MTTMHAAEQVVDGIWQVVLPLPFPIKTVNAYICEDAGGWTIIDAGLNDAPSRVAWQAVFAQIGLHKRDIQRVILTHTHPDHYGGVGWLTQESGAPVYCSPQELVFAQHAWLNEASSEDGLAAFFITHGLPPELGTIVQNDIRALRMLTQPSPREIVTIDAGSEVVIGGRTFRLFETPGHSEGHLVLYSAADRVMLCGDTVLTKITPNIGRWAWGAPNPLADFLETLDRLARFDVALALPGHRAVIPAFAARVGELRQHHMERLAATVAAVGNGAQAYPVCTQIFPIDLLTSHQLRFAMAETLAHLEYLVGIGVLQRQERAGQWMYLRA